MPWKKSWENRSERRRQREEHHEGKAFLIKETTLSWLKSGTVMAKKLERKGYQKSMADYPRIVSVTNYSPSTGMAAKISQAPEQGNSPSLSTSIRTGSHAFSTEESSLTLAMFTIPLIFTIFSTEMMSGRLHTLMIHWYFRRHCKYIYLSLNRSIYLLMLECLLPLLALTPQYCPPFKFCTY